MEPCYNVGEITQSCIYQWNGICNRCYHKRHLLFYVGVKLGLSHGISTQEKPRLIEWLFIAQVVSPIVAVVKATRGSGWRVRPAYNP
jgi:hypothetical protein